MALNYVYFLMNGRLRVEKEVDVYDKNYWPTDKHAWCEKKIDSHVLFKIQEINPYTILGERECIDELIQPVQIVAALPDTRVFMIPRDYIKKAFTLKEQDNK